MKHKLIFKIFFALFICLLTGEIFIRVFKPQKTYSTLLALTGEQYKQGDFIPFTLKPNYKAKMPSMEYPGKFASISTNSLGLRGKEISLNKPSGVKRILILGDSYTFGIYVDDNKIYPAMLENFLRQDGQNIEVINAGYADGWGPDTEYAWLANEGLKFQPDLIIYGFFDGNDYDDISSQNWKTLDEKGLPVKITDDSIYIDNFGRIRSRAVDLKTVGVESIYRIPVLRESHMAIFLINSINDFLINNWGKEESINRNWGINPFPYILTEKDTEDMSQKKVLLMKLVEGMNKKARENNAQFAVLMIPVNFQVNEKLLPIVLGSNNFKVKRDPFDEIKPELEKRNINYIDLLEKMKETPGKYFPDNGEVHFNPQGHDFTAKALKEAITNLQLLD